MDNKTIAGMLTLDELGQKAASGEVTTVLVVFPDLYGRFMGKRVPRPCLAAHVRRTDHWRLSELMGDVRFWPAIEGFVRQIGEQVMIP